MVWITLSGSVFQLLLLASLQGEKPFVHIKSVGEEIQSFIWFQLLWFISKLAPTCICWQPLLLLREDILQNQLLHSPYIPSLCRSLLCPTFFSFSYWIVLAYPVIPCTEDAPDFWLPFLSPPFLFLFFSSARFLLTYRVQKCIQHSSWGKTFPIPLSNNVLTGKRIAHILTITKIHILLSSTKLCTCREFGDKLWLMESSAKCPRLTAGCSQRMQLVEIWKTLIASGSKQHNTSLSFSTCSKTFWNHTVSTLNLGKVICI